MKADFLKFITYTIKISSSYITASKTNITLGATH